MRVYIPKEMIHHKRIYLPTEPESAGTAVAVAAEGFSDPRGRFFSLGGGAVAAETFSAAGRHAGVCLPDHAVRRHVRS